MVVLTESSSCVRVLVSTPLRDLFVNSYYNAAMLNNQDRAIYRETTLRIRCQKLRREPILRSNREVIQRELKVTEEISVIR